VTDFAYRVREFEYSKLRPFSMFKDKGDRSEGAMFGRGEIIGIPTMKALCRYLKIRLKRMSRCSGCSPSERDVTLSV